MVIRAAVFVYYGFCPKLVLGSATLRTKNRTIRIPYANEPHGTAVLNPCRDHYGSSRGFCQDIDVSSSKVKQERGRICIAVKTSSKFL
jgi:hypothetical protein